MSRPLAILLLLALDQATKFAVRANFALHESRPVIRGFFSLTYVRNRGAAWGILNGWGLALVALAAAMLFVLARYRERIFGGGLPGRLAYVLLFAGIVGNLVDRAILGYVVDFLDFHIGRSHFPAFNVADSCICAGVGLYMLASFAAQGSESGARSSGAAAQNG